MLSLSLRPSMIPLTKWRCFLIFWMIVPSTSGLSLSADMTLIISVTFGTILFLIIVGVSVGCICLWYSKKENVEYMDDNYHPPRRSRRLNTVSPGCPRNISMAEFEYLHNKARSEYGLVRPSENLPGYVNPHESVTDPEFHADIAAFVSRPRGTRDRSGEPPPSYDQSQQHHESTTNLHKRSQTKASKELEPSAPPCEDDLPGSNSTPRESNNPPGPSVNHPSSSRSQGKTSVKTGSASGTKTGESERTNTKKSQSGARLITVEDPDKLRMRKLALINKVKKEIDTGERHGLHLNESIENLSDKDSYDGNTNIRHDEQRSNERRENSSNSGGNDEKPRVVRPSDRSPSKRHEESRPRERDATSESQTKRYVRKDKSPSRISGKTFINDDANQHRDHDDVSQGQQSDDDTNHRDRNSELDDQRNLGSYSRGKNLGQRNNQIKHTHRRVADERFNRAEPDMYVEDQTNNEDST